MAVSGDYYVFPETGTIQQQTNSVLAAALKASGWAGPFATMAEAHAAINKTVIQKAKDVPSNVAGDLSSSLSVTGIAGWFFRGLKIIFGGILMIIGVSKLTGADNKITQLASKVPVIPV
jgi:hypothetical protein